MFDARTAWWWSWAPNGAMRARASWSTSWPSGPTSWSAIRAAPTPGTPSCIGEAQFILQQIPSGILHPQVHLHRGQRRGARPETALHRAGRARRARASTRPGRLFVSDRAHLVLPYHKLLDKAQREEPEHRHHRPRHRAHLRGQVRPAGRSGWATCATSPTPPRAVARAGGPGQPTCSSMMGSPSARRSTPASALLERWRRGSCRSRPTPGSSCTGPCKRRRAGAARGRAGRAARRRPRHLSVRHLVQHDRRRCRGRCRHRPDGHRTACSVW